MDRNKTDKIIFFIAFIVVIVFDLVLLLWGIKILGGGNLNFALLNTKGIIATKEKQVIITALLLMLIVVVPVFVAAFWIAFKYRAGNFNNTDYQPEWQGNAKLQFLWWAFPASIIICLGILTWKSSHALDPFKPLDSNVKPITIEVVALNWKWLFIYPEQNIASVNFIEIPENVPVNFALTADAPMNSFWVPQLGGQMYAMAGMTTHLHLMADNQGEFNGSAAEINGKGFSGMNFKVKAVSTAEFEQWQKGVHQTQDSLNEDAYNKLAQPSTDNSAAYYSGVDQNLYESIIQKYMGPAGLDMHANGELQ